VDAWIEFMENISLYSFLLLLGGIIGYVINCLFTWRSQKIQLEIFYSEHFLKVKAERILKTLDLLNQLHHYLLHYEKYEIEQTSKTADEYVYSVVLLNEVIDKEKSAKLLDLINKLTKARDTKKQEDLDEVNIIFRECFKILSAYIPKDYLHKK